MSEHINKCRCYFTVGRDTVYIQQSDHDRIVAKLKFESEYNKNQCVLKEIALDDLQSEIESLTQQLYEVEGLLQATSDEWGDGFGERVADEFLSPADLAIRTYLAKKKGQNEKS